MKERESIPAWRIAFCHIMLINFGMWAYDSVTAIPIYIIRKFALMSPQSETVGLAFLVLIKIVFMFVVFMFLVRWASAYISRRYTIESISNMSDVILLGSIYLVVPMTMVVFGFARVYLRAHGSIGVPVLIGGVFSVFTGIIVALYVRESKRYLDILSADEEAKFEARCLEDLFSPSSFSNNMIWRGEAHEEDQTIDVETFLRLRKQGKIYDHHNIWSDHDGKWYGVKDVEAFLTKSKTDAAPINSNTDSITAEFGPGEK